EWHRRPRSRNDRSVTGEPVRLLIASPDQTVVAGLRSLLAGHADRVVVVDDGVADVVLHDGDGAENDGDLAGLMGRSQAVAWALRHGLDRSHHGVRGRYDDARA